MIVRRLAGAVAIAGMALLGASGLTQHAASAVGICFPPLDTQFGQQPGAASTVTFSPDHAGLTATTNSGLTILSLQLNFADGTSFKATFPAGTTLVADFHATPRQVFVTYIICKDEPVGDTTTTSTTAPTTTGPTTTGPTTTGPTTTGPTTTGPTTTGPTTTGATTTRVTSPQETTPPTTPPTTIPPSTDATSIVRTTPPTLPPTGGTHGDATFIGLIALIAGGSLLLVARRHPAS